MGGVRRISALVCVGARESSTQLLVAAFVGMYQVYVNETLRGLTQAS